MQYTARVRARLGIMLAGVAWGVVVMCEDGQQSRTGRDGASEGKRIR
jgi:hypothetical protein